MKVNYLYILFIITDKIYSLIFYNKPINAEAANLLSLRLDLYTSSCYVYHNNSAETVYFRILLAEAYYLNNMYLQYISHAVSIIENIDRISLDMVNYYFLFF